MSAKNGDRSRFNRLRKAKLAKRERNVVFKAALQKAAEAAKLVSK